MRVMTLGTLSDAAPDYSENSAMLSNGRIPVVNFVLGPVLPTMSCTEGPCEKFWRIDRPRAWVAGGVLLAGAVALLQR